MPIPVGSLDNTSSPQTKSPLLPPLLDEDEEAAAAEFVPLTEDDELRPLLPALASSPPKAIKLRKHLGLSSPLYPNRDEKLPTSTTRVSGFPLKVAEEIISPTWALTLS